MNPYIKHIKRLQAEKNEHEICSICGAFIDIGQISVAVDGEPAHFVCANRDEYEKNIHNTH